MPQIVKNQDLWHCVICQNRSFMSMNSTVYRNRVFAKHEQVFPAVGLRNRPKPSER